MKLSLPHPTRKNWVYFGTAGPGAEGIFCSEFDPVTGSLSDSKLVASIHNPSFLALHPDGNKLYSVGELNQEPSVVAYHLEQDGELTAFDQIRIGNDSAVHVTVHPYGKFLLTAQYDHGFIAWIALDPTGKFQKMRHYQHTGASNTVHGRQDSAHPHFCEFSPCGRFALVPDLGTDQIFIYRVDPSFGMIEFHHAVDTIPGSGPRHLRFSPDGNLIYLLNELNLSVSIFKWQAGDGIAQLLNSIECLSESEKAQESFNSAAEILVHPNGPFVYTSNRGHDSISVFRANVDSSSLHRAQVQPIRGAFPRNFNLSPDGQWLLAAGSHSNSISVHQIHPETGKLTYQTDSIIQVPSPVCIVFANHL
ncbi:MAG: lactonase family protein [Puniceicoccaceae bacterium]